MPDSITPQPVGIFARVAGRSMARVADDELHYMGHTLEGDTADCPICVVVRERHARYDAEHPEAVCPECGRPYDDA